MSQKSKLIGGLILGLVLGAGGVFLYVTPTLDQYEYLILENIELKQDNDDFQERIASLSTDIDELEDEYRSLQSDNTNKNTMINQLEIEKTELATEVEHVSENWKKLSDDVMAFRDTLNSYCYLNESFTRIFTSSEIDKIADTVESMTWNDDNIWDGLNRIHAYVRDDIEYVYDSDVPVIGEYTYFGDSDSPLVSDFDTYYRQNMYQDLDFTVEYEQGDCDDQAMLEYAMIKYYERYILDEEYTIYLVRMDWDDTAHLTVFQPVSDGQICILDPAGQYQTDTWGRLDGKPAREELNNYENYWFNENGPIRSIELYSVDIDTGDHYRYLSGSLEDVIEYFES